MTAMSITSVGIGTLPNSLIATQNNNNINSLMQKLQQLDEQLSTGLQFTLPGQNPQATSSILPIQQNVAAQTQYQTNLTTDQSFLSTTDSALQTVGNSISQANSLLLSGLGATSTPAENQADATQVGTIISGLINTANSTFQGQYLFGGSASQQAPFQVETDGTVLYTGNQSSINSQVDSGLVLPNNVDGVTAFGAISTPLGSDINPALTLQTNLSDLNNGRGVPTGSIQVTLTPTSGPSTTETINLTQARTVSDVQQLIQGAFPPGAVTVGIAPGSPADALTISGATGTVAVSDLNGGTTAESLGLAGAAAPSITSGDLNPLLTLQTDLSALNGGQGVDTTDGIQITDGSTQQTVNISGDTTVQDLLNTLQSADPNLSVGINVAGNGLAISTRLSGANFSIGENGGTTATDLGIRTMTGSTLLSSLNLGQGVPVTATDSSGNPVPANLEIQRRDGSTVEVNLAGAVTVQDVLNDINAVAPGQLVASLNSVGNGISVTDNDGSSTGPLTITSNPISQALGIAGTQSSTDPTQPLVGQDVNPQQANGVFNLLVQLQSALQTSNNAELTRLQPLFQQELTRVSDVQGAVGSRQQLLSQIQNQASTTQTNLQSSLSNLQNVNMATAITQLTQIQTSLQATLQVAASSMQLNLFQYLQ
jgi:flagellar hook-associated protein 3 FlgL